MDFQIIINALTSILNDIVGFIPKLVNGLIVLLVGYLVARLARWLVSAILSRLRLDALLERSGISQSLGGFGIRLPLSRLAAQAIFALLLLSFLITATRLMALESVAKLLEQLLLFLPNMIAALIIFVIGGMAAQFAGGLVGTLAEASGVQQGARLGTLVRAVITLFVIVLALSQLGVDTSILVTALTIMIAAFGLALGLALGLGARSIILHVLAGYYLRQRLATGQQISLNDLRGQVGGVGSVNTLITAESGTLLVPNTMLLESVVRTGSTPPPA